MEAYIRTLNAQWVEKVHKMREYERVSIERGSVGAVQIFTVRPRDPPFGLSVDPDHEHTIFLYVHGGGFVGGDGEAGLAEPLLIADRLRVRTVAIDYRTALKDPFPAAIDDVMSVYLYFREHEPYNSIVLGGTSAGGNIAMVVIQKLLTLRKRVPDVAYFGTPVADVTGCGVSLEANRGFDLVLGDYKQYAPAVKRYVGNRGTKDPMISPLLGSFEGFPPSLLVSGTRDLLLSNTVSAHTKMRKSLVDASLLIYEGFSHADYLHLPDSDDSHHLYRELNALVKSHCKNPIEDIYDLYLYAYPLIVFEKLRAMNNIPTGRLFQIQGLENTAALPDDGIENRALWISLEKGPVQLNITQVMLDDRSLCLELFDAALRPMTLDRHLEDDRGIRASKGDRKDGMRSVVVVYRAWRGSNPFPTTQKRLFVDSVMLLLVIKAKTNNWDAVESSISLTTSDVEMKLPKRSEMLQRIDIPQLSTLETFQEFFGALRRVQLELDPWVSAKMRKVGMRQERAGWTWAPAEKFYSRTLMSDIEDVWIDNIFKAPTALVCGTSGELNSDTPLRAEIAFADPVQFPCEKQLTLLLSTDTNGERLVTQKSYSLALREDVQYSWATAVTSSGEMFDITSPTTLFTFLPKAESRKTSERIHFVVVRIYNPIGVSEKDVCFLADAQDVFTMEGADERRLVGIVPNRA